MKKTLLVGLLVMTLLGVIAFSLMRVRATSPYLITAIDGSIRTMASSSGLRIEEQRRSSATIRGSRFAMLDRLSNRVSGRPLYNDMDEYLLKAGSDTVHVTLYYSLGKVGSVEIRPSSMPSKQAEAVRSGLTTAFPGLNCHMDTP
jgi:hypothetical protein